tara:strand:+ start:4240 stop:4410 length:171 start_codon:yes stop_codon:yes gene_type:complete
MEMFILERNNLNFILLKDTCFKYSEKIAFFIALESKKSVKTKFNLLENKKKDNELL